jgi:hypothetical protein
VSDVQEFGTFDASMSVSIARSALRLRSKSTRRCPLRPFVSNAVSKPVRRGRRD